MRRQGGGKSRSASATAERLRKKQQQQQKLKLQEQQQQQQQQQLQQQQLHEHHDQPYSNGYRYVAAPTSDARAATPSASVPISMPASASMPMSASASASSASIPTHTPSQFDVWQKLSSKTPSMSPLSSLPSMQMQNQRTNTASNPTSVSMAALNGTTSAPPTTRIQRGHHHDDDTFHNIQSPTCIPLMWATRDVFPELQSEVPLQQRRPVSLFGKLVRKSMLERRAKSADHEVQYTDFSAAFANRPLPEKSRLALARMAGQDATDNASAAAASVTEPTSETTSTTPTASNAKRKKRRKRKKKKNAGATNDATNGEQQVSVQDGVNEGQQPQTELLQSQQAQIDTDASNGDHNGVPMIVDSTSGDAEPDHIDIPLHGAVGESDKAISQAAGGMVVLTGTEGITSTSSSDDALNDNTSHSIDEWLDMVHKGDGDKVPPPPDVDDNHQDEAFWQLPPEVVQLGNDGGDGASNLVVDDVVELDQSVHYHTERLKVEATILPPPSLDRLPSQDTLTDLVGGPDTEPLSTSEHGGTNIVLGGGGGGGGDDASWAQHSFATLSAGTTNVSSLAGPPRSPAVSRRSTGHAAAHSMLPPQSPSTIEMIPDESAAAYVATSPVPPSSTIDKDSSSNTDEAKDDAVGILFRNPLEIEYLTKLEHYSTAKSRSSSITQATANGANGQSAPASAGTTDDKETTAAGTSHASSSSSVTATAAATANTTANTTTNAKSAESTTASTDARLLRPLAPKLTTTIEGYHVPSLHPVEETVHDDAGIKPMPLVRSESNFSASSSHKVSLFDEWLGQIVESKTDPSYVKKSHADGKNANATPSSEKSEDTARQEAMRRRKELEHKWTDENLSEPPANRDLSRFLEYIKPQLECGTPIVSLQEIKDACFRVHCVGCQKDSLKYLQILEECMFGPRANGCTLPSGMESAQQGGAASAEQQMQQQEQRRDAYRLVLNPNTLQESMNDIGSGQEVTMEGAFDYVALEEGNHPWFGSKLDQLRDIVVDTAQFSGSSNNNNNNLIDHNDPIFGNEYKRADHPNESNIESFIAFSKHTNTSASTETPGSSKQSKRRDATSSSANGGGGERHSTKNGENGQSIPQELKLALRPMSMENLKSLMEDFLPCGVEEDVMVSIAPTRDTRPLHIQKQETQAIYMNVAHNESVVIDLLHEMQTWGWDMNRDLMGIRDTVAESMNNPEGVQQNIEYTTMPTLNRIELTCNNYMLKVFQVLNSVTSERTHAMQELQMKLWIDFLDAIHGSLRSLDAHYKNIEENLADQMGTLPKPFINAPMRNSLQKVAEKKTDLWTVLGNSYGMILTESLLKEWFTRLDWQDMRVPENSMKTAASKRLDEACRDLAGRLIEWTHTIMAANIRGIGMKRIKRTSEALEVMQGVVEPLAAEYATVERYFSPERNKYFASLRSNVVLAHGVKQRMRLMDEGEVESMMVGVILMWRHVRLMQARTIFAVRCPPLPLHLKSWMYLDTKPWGYMTPPSQIRNLCLSNGGGGKRRILCIVAGLLYRWLSVRCLEWNAKMAEEELLDLDFNEQNGSGVSSIPNPGKSGKRNKKKKKKVGATAAQQANQDEHAAVATTPSTAAAGEAEAEAPPSSSTAATLPATPVTPSEAATQQEQKSQTAHEGDHNDVETSCALGEPETTQDLEVDHPPTVFVDDRQKLMPGKEYLVQRMDAIMLDPNVFHVKLT